MKFGYKLVIILLTSILYIKSISLKNNKSNPPLIDVAHDLAKIAHEMAYTKYDKKTTTEPDFLIEGGIVENENYKASFGTLKRDRNIVVLVFRGTANFQNFLADINFKLAKLTDKDNKPCPKCLVHVGFRNAYKDNLRPRLRIMFSQYILNKLKSDNLSSEKSMSIYFIGHSLGGALASIAAYDTGVYLASQNISNVKLGLVTFGAPRVGNAEFAKYMNEQLGLNINIRITYKNDPIIKVPWQSKFIHSGTEYNFTDLKNYKRLPQNVDESPRTSYIKFLFHIFQQSDHKQYKNLDDNSVSEIIRFYIRPKILK
jgi:hypothetical protein